MILLRYLWFRWDSEHHIHECKDDSEYECNPESADLKSRDKFRHQEHHEDIDNERNESKREDIEWKGENLEYGDDRSIHDGEYHSNDDGSQIAIDRSTRDEVCGYSNRYSWEEEIEKNSHKKKGLRRKGSSSYSSCLWIQRKNKDKYWSPKNSSPKTKQ